MDVVSFKILKEYSTPVNDVLKKWKEEKDNASKGSSSSSESDDEDRKKNDFRIDRQRIKAAHFYEKTNERLTFDPDSDGFNFGYERALTFKVRVNMLKIIRKEILAHNSRFWDHSQEALKTLNSLEAKEKAELPGCWTQDVHDLNLLQAVAKDGL